VPKDLLGTAENFDEMVGQMRILAGGGRGADSLKGLLKLKSTGW
jgi:hypothetical protein